MAVCGYMPHGDLISTFIVAESTYVSAAVRTSEGAAGKG